MGSQKASRAEPDSKALPAWQAPAWTTHAPYLESSSLRNRDAPKAPLFEKLNGTQIGVDFQNLLKRENIKNYLLTGAGLSVGDIDQNGLPDLFLISQDGPNKLFKQTAPWQFEDVTEASGIRDIRVWGAGSAFADFDNDGDLDLYVCNKAAYDEIYINQGDGTFKGNTIGSGNSSLRAPTMVSFSDYDLDGDLDFYQTSTRLLGLTEMFGTKIDLVKDDQDEWQAHPKYQGEFEVIDGIPRELGTQDLLFRNEGSNARQPFKFSEVTFPSGIKKSRDHGLAAVWWDFNNDHYPDLYVSNDFHTPDRLYQNNKDGTFSEVTEDALAYTSWSSMGSDFADINNDGWFDYLSTDMSATTHYKQKTMMGAMTDTAWFLDNLEPRQYMRNALHVNTGTGSFLETAFFSGLDSTDWTWSGIFGDLDNDGFEDAFFTNGIERNVQDSDMNLRMVAAQKEGATEDELKEIFLNSPRFQERNLAFKNQGNFHFSNVAKEWGLDHLSVSHGAILSDLDRDGDLDLIVNNMNEAIGIFRNNGTQNALLVSLVGTKNNHFGLGARITVELEDGKLLSRIITSSRGYMSGCEPVAHFGVGTRKRIKSLKVQWPGGREQIFNSLESGKHYRITEAGTKVAPKPSPSPAPLFVKAPDNLGVNFKHRENDYNDFLSQPLLPNRLSRFGPAFSVADLNGDQRPDLFFGGAAGYEAAIYLQLADGKHERQKTALPKGHAGFEDVASAFFDFDQDGDLDLYVVSGGARHPGQSSHYRDRLYLNDGDGKLSPATLGLIPGLFNSGSCVAPCDFDNDGDIDLFVGSRMVPDRYPTAPTSSLLRNEGGRLLKIESPPNHSGMVTGATWADLDGDNRPDLIVSTEWGSVKTFKNTAGGMIETTLQAGLSDKTGWWTCIETADIDQDGDLDLIAGNFGLNTKYHADQAHPASLFASDFGGQGKLQLVEAQEKEGKLLPIRGRSCSTTAMPHLKKNAPSYGDFARKSLFELYTPGALKKALHLQANTLASTLFRNDGSGHFQAEPLPTLAQLAPVMSIATGDFDKDGIIDLALGQNFHDAQRETGRMNAGLGVILKSTKGGAPAELWPRESGFFQRTNLRHLKAIDLNGDGHLDLISANNSDLALIHFGKK